MFLHFWYRFKFLQKHCTCLQYLFDKWFFLLQWFILFYFFLFWEFTLSTYPPPCFVTPPIFEVTVKLPRFALSKFACLRIRWSVLVVEKKCLELFRLFFQFPSFFFVCFFIPFFLLVSPSFFFSIIFLFHSRMVKRALE